MEIKELELEYKRILKISPKTLRVSLGVIAANFLLESDPVWCLIVGSSGRSKSETLNLFSDLPNVIKISDFTAQSLISGLRTKRADGFGILQKLQKGGKYLILVSDMSGILSLHPEKQNTLFAILRNVYDGYYAKPFGNPVGLTKWWGKVGFLGGVTEAIDHHHNARQKFGSRFLYWRLERQNLSEDLELTINAIRRTPKEKEWRVDLKRAVTTEIYTHLGVISQRQIFEKLFNNFNNL